MNILSIQKKAAAFDYALTSLSSGSFADHLAVLGLFKVIHQQLDGRVRGYWKNSTFHLQTDKTQEQIVDFFVNDYQPLPLFCVWDNNSAKPMAGMLEKIGERFPAALAVHQELLALREEYDPEFSSSKEVSVYVGKNKRGQDRFVKLSQKKQLLTELFEKVQDERFQEILCSLAIPYVYEGVKTVQYTKLGSGAGGYLPSQKCLDFPYWSAVLGSERKHFESTIFGIAHPDCLVPDVNLPHLDASSNWADQVQFGIGHVSSSASHKSWLGKKRVWGGDPVLTLLMVEGMGFFRGRLATGTAHTAALKGVDFNEVVSSENYVRSIPFTVKNNSLSFTTGSMMEQQSNGSAQEIWAPQWEQSMTYRALLTEIRNLSEVAQTVKVTLNESSDMMLFLSGKGKENGVSVFHRYLLPARQGQGSPVVVPLEKFDCRNDVRSDVVTSLLPALRDIRKQLNSENVCAPNSVLSRFEKLDGEVNAFMSGGSSVTRLSVLFVELIQHLRRSLLERDKVSVKSGSVNRVDRRYYPTQLHANGKNEVKVNGRAVYEANTETFKFSAKWIASILKENNTPEVRLALSIAKQRPFSTLNDISELLEGVLDNELIEKLTMMFEMSHLPKDLQLGATEGDTPWLPMDYVVGALLNQHRSGDSNADAADVRTWRNLVDFNMLDDAMSVGIHRLGLRRVTSKKLSVFSSTPQRELVIATEIPLSNTDIQLLCSYIN